MMICHKISRVEVPIVFLIDQNLTVLPDFFSRFQNLKKGLGSQKVHFL